MEKTIAVLIRNEIAIAHTYTSARNDNVVSYGWRLVDDAILQVGRAKISRSKKYLGNRELMFSLEDKFAFVNYGGGDPI